MGLLKKSGEFLEVKKMVRTVDILSADKSIKAPAMKFKIQFLPDEEFREMSKPFTEDGDATIINITRNPDYKTAVGKAAVVGWTGVTKENLRRSCELFAMNPDAVADVPKTGLEFSPDDRDYVMSQLEPQLFILIIQAIQDLNGFAVASIKEEKNE